MTASANELSTLPRQRFYALSLFKRVQCTFKAKKCLGRWTAKNNCKCRFFSSSKCIYGAVL